MILFKDALNIVLANTFSFGTIKIPLEKANGYILKEQITADRDFPPFNRVTMDGIAFNWEFFNKGQRKFKIEGVGAAGSPQLELIANDNCVEIMTGAILPKNTDTVIRYEDVVVENGFAILQVDTINQGKNIHRKGEDRHIGDVIIATNKEIASAEIGVAATVGKTHLEVAKMPRIVIISTGDELVNVGEVPLPHQIRKSNVHTIKSFIQSLNIVPQVLHLKDDKQNILSELRNLLDTNDVIIMSGGVSKGKFDYVPDALEELGVEKLFHRVAQRPGKPFWFGKSKNNTLVFAFPGNPISSIMCTVRYFKPWLETCLGLIENQKYGILTSDVEFKPSLTFMMQAKIINLEDGRVGLEPIRGHGSGDLASLVDADAFVELPMGSNLYKTGEVFKYFPYRN